MDWGSVPDWIVAATAIVGVGAGLVQLVAIRRSNHQAAQFQRANLLLEFDRDFESDRLFSARQRTLVVRNRIEQEVNALRPALDQERQRDEIATRFSNYVKEVWTRSRNFDGDPDAPRDSASNELALLMRLPFWCETLGFQCKRNLLPLEDVLDLYDQLIIYVIGNLRSYIKLRAEQGPHNNAAYLEHAVWLYDQAAERKRRREARPAETVNRARQDWRS